MPTAKYDGGEWKEAKLHPDCFVAVEGDYYSAPHIHRHRTLRIKLTENQVEIFLNLERLAIRPRCRMKTGQRIKIKEHFPPNSDAYYEATPQRLLSQSRFIHPDLNNLFIELFNDDVFAHIRRAMGLVDELYDRIAQDPRHTQVAQIVREPIEQRRFAHWSMGFSTVDPLDADLLIGEHNFFESASCLSRLGTGRAKKLLVAFGSGRWGLERTGDNRVIRPQRLT